MTGLTDITYVTFQVLSKSSIACFYLFLVIFFEIEIGFLCSFCRSTYHYNVLAHCWSSGDFKSWSISMISSNCEISEYYLKFFVMNQLREGRLVCCVRQMATFLRQNDTF